MTIIVAVDLELSGPDVSRHFVVQVGMAAVRLDDDDGPTPVLSGSWFVHQPTNKSWDERTVREFWLVDGLGKQTLDRYSAPDAIKMHAGDVIAQLLQRFELLRCMGDEEIVLVGDCLTGDYVWLKYMLELFAPNGPRSPNRLVAPDRFTPIVQTGDYVRGLCGESSFSTVSSQRCWRIVEERFGLSRWSEADAHCAHDAYCDASSLARRFARLLHAQRLEATK